MATKKEILEAAAALFKEKGYEKASLRDIANKVGIKQPSLYHYINSKQDLLYEIIKTTTQDGLDRVQNIKKMPISVDQKLQRCIQTHFDSLMNSYPEISVLIHEKIYSLSEDNQKEIRRLYSQYINMINDIIEEGVKKSVLRKDLDVKLTTWALMGMINWVYKWGKVNGRVGFSQIAEYYSDIFLKGVLKQP